MRALLATSVALGLVGPLSSQVTWYVDEAGRLGVPTIQEAIDVAADGDVIVVVDGDYDDWFVVDGKSLTIAALEGTQPCMSGVGQAVRVENLTAGQRVVVRGIEFDAWPGNSSQILIRNNHGSVRIEDMRIRSGHNTVPACTVERSADVAFDGASIESIAFANPTTSSSDGGIALEVIESNVALFRCDVLAAHGYAGGCCSDGGDGGDAMVIDDAVVHATDSTIRGGSGGAAAGSISCGVGGDGGSALIVTGERSHVALLASSIEAGAGGNAPSIEPCGPGDDGVAVVSESGVVTTLDGPTATLDVASTVVLPGSLAGTVATTPDAHVWLAGSFQTGFVFDPKGGLPPVLVLAPFGLVALEAAASGLASFEFAVASEFGPAGLALQAVAVGVDGIAVTNPATVALVTAVGAIP